MAKLLKIIDDKPTWVEDDWRFVTEDQVLTVTDNTKVEQLILPMTTWLDYYKKHSVITGVWLAADELIDVLQPHIMSLNLIVLDFPVLTDGRAFSKARMLRQNYAYKGELRASGVFMLDQLFYMKRCGFNAFVFSEAQMASLTTIDTFIASFDLVYQSAADSFKPLLKRS